MSEGSWVHVRIFFAIGVTGGGGRRRGWAVEHFSNVRILAQVGEELKGEENVFISEVELTFWFKRRG